jgi:hypothetical protein
VPTTLLGKGTAAKRRAFRIEDRRGPVLKGLNQPAQMFHRHRSVRAAVAGLLRELGGPTRPGRAWPQRGVTIKPCP